MEDGVARMRLRLHPPSSILYPRAQSYHTHGQNCRVGALRGLAAVVVCLVLGQLRCFGAQPAAAPSESPPNRYLLVVDTSRAMEPRRRALLKTVEQLLKSGLGGQIRAGDELGVWTYNADLYAGRFPLQRWANGQEKDITARALAFLKSQKFEHLPLLDSTFPALGGVISRSPLITVILVTCGDGIMQGTPFDHRINEFWQGALEKQRAAQMPFVVVLRAQEGAIRDFTLNLPPAPVRMPVLLTESPAPVTAPQKQALVKPPQARSADIPVRSDARTLPDFGALTGPAADRNVRASNSPPAAQLGAASGNKAKALQPPKAEQAAPLRAQPLAILVTNEAGGPVSEPAPPAPAPKHELAKVDTVPVKPVAPLPAPVVTSNASTATNAPPPKPPPSQTETAKAEPKAMPPVNTPAPAPPAKAPELVPLANTPPALPAKAEAAKAPVEKPVTAAVTESAAPPATPASKPVLASATEPKPAQAAPVKAASVPLPPPPPTPVARAIEAPKLAFGPKPTFEPASPGLAPGSAQTAGPLVGSSNHLAIAPSGAAANPRALVTMPPAPVPAAVIANTNSPLARERGLVAMPAAPRDIAALPTTSRGQFRLWACHGAPRGRCSFCAGGRFCRSACDCSGGELPGPEDHFDRRCPPGDGCAWLWLARAAPLARDSPRQLNYAVTGPRIETANSKTRQFVPPAPCLSPGESAARTSCPSVGARELGIDRGRLN